MSSTTSAAAAASTTASAGAKPQGGILEGLNPIEYSPKDPIPLFIIQVGLHNLASLDCAWRVVVGVGDSAEDGFAWTIARALFSSTHIA